MIGGGRRAHDPRTFGFYASPLATVMAILLAGIAKGIGGEEEEQVPGALSMQPGLLST